LLVGLETRLLSSFGVYIEEDEQSDFLNWLLETYRIGTESPEVLVRALAYSSMQEGQLKQDFLKILFTSLEQARTAYAPEERAGNTYSCLGGTTDRILDGFWPLVPEDERIKDIATQSMDHLVHLFLRKDGNNIVPSILFKSFVCICTR
jgi:hypothetical protein